MLLVDELQGVTIPTHFLFITVAQERSAEDQGANACMFNLYTLNAVGGHCTFDQGVLTQGFQPLGRLFGEQLLLATGLSEIREIPGCGGRDGVELVGKPPQSHHVAASSSNNPFASCRSLVSNPSVNQL